MKAIKYLLAAFLVITVTKKMHPIESSEPQTAGHLDAFHSEDEQSDQQDVTSDLIEKIPSLHDSVSQIQKNTLRAVIPNYTESFPPTIADSGLISIKPFEDKLSDNSPGPLFPLEPSATGQTEQELPLNQLPVKSESTTESEESLTPLKTETVSEDKLTQPEKDILEKEDNREPESSNTIKEMPQMTGMPTNQIITTTVNAILRDYKEPSSQIIHQIHNALHQKSMNEPEDDIIQQAATDAPAIDDVQKTTIKESLSTTPLRDHIATQVQAILPNATHESVSNNIHPDLINHALNNPEPEEQATADEKDSIKNQILSMPLRDHIATQVQAILPKATHESVSNIIHPDLINHALNNPEPKEHQPASTEDSVEPTKQKNPDYSKALTLGNMGNSKTSEKEQPSIIDEEEAPIFIDPALLKTKNEPKPSKNLEYYDPKSKTVQIKNGPLFISVVEYNNITETPPNTMIRSLQKIPATIPTPNYSSHIFHGGIKPRISLYGLCVEHCNPYVSTTEPSYPVKSIIHTSKTIGTYWPNSNIVQYHTGETFVNVVQKGKVYIYRSPTDKPSLDQIKQWFDRKKLLKQYGISTRDDDFESLINQNGIGTISIEKRHKTTLYGVQLKNPYTPIKETPAEALEHNKQIRHITHDALNKDLEKARKLAQATLHRGIEKAWILKNQH